MEIATFRPDPAERDGTREDMQAYRGLFLFPLVKGGIEGGLILSFSQI